MTQTDDTTDRFDAVFEVLGRLERGSGVLRPGIRSMTVAGDQAWVPGTNLAGVPVDPSAAPVGSPGEAADRRTTASLVRFSKFSNDGCVRVRAFYLDHDPPLTVKLVIGSRRRQAPVVRDAKARSRPERWEHLAIPRLVESGRGRGFAYFVEELVNGRHASDRAERQRVAEFLVGSVVAARPSPAAMRLHVHRRTVRRLGELFESAGSPPDLPVSDLLDVARRIRSCRLPGGWCHGDLVPSNVVIGDDALHVIDFEHAARMPIACDLAKAIAKAPDWRPLLQGVVAEDPLGVDEIDTRTQLAMVYLRELSWWQHREARAAAAGRLANHRAWMDRSFELLSELMAAG